MMLQTIPITCGEQLFCRNDFKVLDFFDGNVVNAITIAHHNLLPVGLTHRPGIRPGHSLYKESNAFVFQFHKTVGSLECEGYHNAQRIVLRILVF